MYGWMDAWYLDIKGSNFSTHKGHLPPIMFLRRHSPPRRGRATWMPLADLLVLCTALSGDCEFRSGASSGIPALRHVADFSPFAISFPCFLSSLPLSNHLNHFLYPPTFQPLPADPASPFTGHQDNHRLWSSKKAHAAAWCVCVYAWNLNRRQKLFGCFFFSFLISAGGRGMQSGTASNEATWLHGIQSLISCAYRLGSIFQFVWQAAKPITAQPFFHVCNWANLRLRWKWKDNYTDLFLWTSYTGSSWLVNPICFPPLIRKNWILDLLHDRCIPHHNSVRQVWASVLLTSVRPDAVSFSWNTCLGRMFDPPTWSLNLHSSSCNSFKKSETASHFFTFHPVVCRWLNNWPGFAFFRFSPCRLWLVEQLTAIPGFISFCQPRKPPFSTLSERLTSFWHCNMTSFMLQDMPFRCGHFLVVDLVKSSCAGIGGLTTSAVYGVDLNFRPLILIRGFCIGLLIHQFVIETDSPCLISTVIHLPHLCAGHHFALVAILLLATTVPDKYPLPSCTFSARNLRVTVIFGRGFKWFSCTQHQSSLHAYLLSTLQSPHAYPCRLTF